MFVFVAELFLCGNRSLKTDTECERRDSNPHGTRVDLVIPAEFQSAAAANYATLAQKSLRPGSNGRPST